MVLIESEKNNSSRFTTVRYSLLLSRAYPRIYDFQCSQQLKEKSILTLLEISAMYVWCVIEFHIVKHK